MMAFTRGNTRLLGALRLPVGICVCGHTPLTNLAALGERFGHDAEEEVWTALAERSPRSSACRWKGWWTSAAWTYQGYGGTVSRSVPIHRRSAMRVRDGRVLKKNNWRLDAGDYRALAQDEIRLDRRRPPDGSRHLITIAELRRFVGLLPDWDEVAVGLDAIVLDSATDCAGWCAPRVVAICAWPHDLWDWWPAKMVNEHRHILDLLEVERVPLDESREHRELRDELTALGVEATAVSDDLELRWTEPQARAYQLLHILPHELGHHHDRITSRGRRTAGRGEPYAEAYANRVLERVWPGYARAFPV